jgi:hypothetical protein
MCHGENWETDGSGPNSPAPSFLPACHLVSGVHALLPFVMALAALPWAQRTCFPSPWLTAGQEGRDPFDGGRNKVDARTPVPTLADTSLKHSGNSVVWGLNGAPGAERTTR